MGVTKSGIKLHLPRQAMWDQRYSNDDYAYGTEPNDCLVDHFHLLPKGRVLCLAEGEGRNAVFLAGHGFDVTAVDNAKVGLEKAKRLAEAHEVSIHLVHADLADFDLGENQWDAIVSIFCHLPPALRVDLHRRCVESLKSDGLLLLEAYTPRQLEYKTGGPPVAEMMMDAACLQQELAGLEFLVLQDCDRNIHEGVFHNGRGAVVQALAKKV